MLTFIARDRETGDTFYCVGLTDVNLRRLQDPDEDGSITLPLERLIGDNPNLRGEVILFHATRDRCVTLARGLGLDERILLDRIGEG